MKKRQKEKDPTLAGKSPFCQNDAFIIQQNILKSNISLDVGA